jgi:hypothetical protein
MSGGNPACCAGAGESTHQAHKVLVRHLLGALTKLVNVIQEVGVLRVGQEVLRLPALLHRLQDGQHLLLGKLVHAANHVQHLVGRAVQHLAVHNDGALARGGVRGRHGTGAHDGTAWGSGRRSTLLQHAA